VAEDQGKPKKPAKKPADKKPAAKPKQPEELGIDDDFLDDLDEEIDDIVSAPTEEHPAPEGAIELEDQEDEEELDDEELDEDEDDEELEEDDQPTLVGSAAGGGGGGAGQADFGRPRRRFPLWARFFAASILIVASIAGATAASLILYLSDIASALSHNDDLIGADKQLEAVQGGAPQTILIVGSDHREGQGAGHGLSDTTMLLRVDPDRKAIALFSIPRDLEVNIPGVGLDKFNAAYSLGGPKLTLETVKALTGLDVNHIVNVDFTGFAKAVSAIGCVYVDVDRRYYHSNQGLAASAQYSEIDVRPGYQRLCGYKALEYVRFRHTDNDIVRNARQQDFLREARARVPATDLLTKNRDLIHIFTHYTSSDIGDPGTMLQVLKLFIEARNEPVKEVHFPGTIGNNVTVTPGQIEQAVSQFLGIEGTKGPRGATAAAPTGQTPAPEEPKGGGNGKTATPATPAPSKKKKAAPSTTGLEGGTYGKKLAYRIRRRNRKVPIYYPTTVLAGSEYAQRPRVYNLADHTLSADERFAYKFTLKTPAGEYYGLQGLSWTDAPILDEPHETKQFGDRTYNLYYDNDRLRMISWEDNGMAFWVSNTLLQTLTADQMVAIARGAKLLPPTG
jgi:polyisoprenyl-teichoic acid--peptidoglycan teichoic acid transferase